MKIENKEKIKKQILDHKINDNNPNEFFHAKIDASFAKFNAKMMPVDTGLGALCLAGGIVDLACLWPVGIFLAVPAFALSAMCFGLVAKQIKFLKNYGKRYGLSFKDTIKSLFDKEVFETMSTNSFDLKKGIKLKEPEEHYEPKQPIYSLTDEELLGKQTTEIENQKEQNNSAKQAKKSTKKEESQVEEEIEKEK